MKDRELFELIGSSALRDAPRKDFEDVKRRIVRAAAEDAAEDNLVGEDFFGTERGRSGFSRYAAAAAAVVVIGFAAAAAGNIISAQKNNSAQFDASADQASVMYEEAYESSPAATTIPGINAVKDGSEEDSYEPESPAMAQEMAPETSLEQPGAVNDAVDHFASESSDKESIDNSGTVTEEADEPPASPTDAPPEDIIADISGIELVPYSIGELGMTLDVPSFAYCTGVNVPDNYPPLAKFGIDAKKLESNYRARGICFNAVWFDDGADVVELVAASEDCSDAANSLAAFSEYDIEQLRQSYLLYGLESPDLPRYYDVSVVNIGKQPYIRALGQDRSGKAYHAQYMTIINGRSVKLSLIEHFTDTPMPEDGISPAHAALMDKIASTIKYDHVRSQFAYRLSRITLPIWASLFGIAVLLVYGVKYIIDQRKLAEQELAEDEQTLMETADALAYDDDHEAEYGISDEDGVPPDIPGDDGDWDDSGEDIDIDDSGEDTAEADQAPESAAGDDSEAEGSRA